MLYALQQQSEHGKCEAGRPSTWDVVEQTKWQSWNALGNMNRMEAMRLFVKTVDEEVPEWWALFQRWEEDRPDAGAGEPARSPTSPPPASPAPIGRSSSLRKSQSLDRQRSLSPTKYASRGAWTHLDIPGAEPAPRYLHTTTVTSKGVLIVVGGNCSGRYLGDVWALDLTDGGWQALSGPRAPDIVPMAAHVTVLWKGKLLVIGGFRKANARSEELGVLSFDPGARVWAEVATAGDKPEAKGNHSASLVGSFVVVFGGELAKGRRNVADVHVLDLNTLTWAAMEVAGTAPAARSSHTAAAYLDRFILIFGGGNVSNCFNDVHVLDLHDMSWSKPECSGPAPAPRAGHSCALVGSLLYILGGGDNTGGCSGLACLDVSNVGAGLIAWVDPEVNQEGMSWLASEGLTLSYLEEDNTLLAYGGYNGKYLSTVSLLPLAGDGKVDGADTFAAITARSYSVQMEATKLQAQSARKEALTVKRKASKVEAQLADQVADLQARLEAALGELRAEEAKSAALAARVAALEARLAGTDGAAGGAGAVGADGKGVVGEPPAGDVAAKPAAKGGLLAYIMG